MMIFEVVEQFSSHTISRGLYDTRRAAETAQARLLRQDRMQTKIKQRTVYSQETA